MIGPDGGVTQYVAFAPATTSNGPGFANAGLVYKICQPDSSVIERVWQHKKPAPNAYVQTQGGITPSNPYVRYEFRTLPGSGGCPAGAPSGPMTAATGSTYDKNGNQLERDDYDFFAPSSVTRASGSTAVPIGLSGANPARSTINTEVVVTPTAGDGTETSEADTASDYWNPTNNGSPTLLNLPAHSALTGVGPGSVTEYGYDTFGHGNVTQLRMWDSTVGGGQPGSLNSANALIVNRNYDSYGNLTDSYDIAGNRTHYDYNNSLYLVDRIDADGTPLQETTTYTFDFNSGVPTQTKDANNLVTNYSYDLYSRLMTTTELSGSELQRLTTNLYEDFSRRIVVTSDLNKPGDQALQSVTHYDQLGRVRLSRQLECSVAAANLSACTGQQTTPQSVDDDTAGIKVLTRYCNSASCGAPSGVRYQLVSNPFRAATSALATSAAELTMGWTLTTSDILGRTISQQTFSATPSGVPPGPFGGDTSSTGNTATSYSANTIAITDPANHARTLTMDGLGRLKSVQEDPTGFNYNTQYTYDALDNLATVTQGSQSRAFTYDSMKRLATAQNPESGTISYTYSSAAGSGICAGDA